MRQRLPSPNFDDRAPNVALRYIVLHYTGMKDEEAAMMRMTDPNAKVSAHYVISENGDIWDMVDESKRAWHAGESFWRGTLDLNSASIGIELVNPGHEFGYRPFPELQISGLKELLRDIVERKNLSPEKGILAHSDIAPRRKQDPGELFPWEELAKEGFGVWETQIPEKEIQLNQDQVTEALGIIGYDISDLSAALQAFQRRFCPKNLTGEADPLTNSRLLAIKDLFAE